MALCIIGYFSHTWLSWIEVRQCTEGQKGMQVPTQDTW